MLPDHTSPATPRRRRGPLVAVVIVGAALVAACTPASGGFNIAIGGTVNLPPIVAAPAFQGGSLGTCQVGFETPGLNITGATATIPGINVNITQGTITVPNVMLNLPSIRIQLPQIVTCLGNVDLGILQLPPTQVTATAVLDVATSQLTINATLTIPFSILGFSVPIVIPLSPIVVHL